MCPYSYFWWCRYFWSPWVSFMMTDESLVRVSKVISKINVSWTHSLLFQFFPFFVPQKMAILSKTHKPDKWATNISKTLLYQSWNFVGCKSFLKIKLSWHSCSVWNNFYDSVDSGNFSVRGYLPLTQKDFVTHIHSLAYYVKGELPFAQDLGLENREFLFIFRLTSLHLVSYFFPLFHGLGILHSMSYFFFLYQWSSSLCTVFDAVSSKIDEFLSIIASVERICLWRL